MDRFAVAALTLIDGDIEIPIRPEVATAGDPIFCRVWDLGAPEVRQTSTPRAGSDGVDMSDGLLGARTVTMELKIRGDGKGRPDGHDPYWYVQQLTGMCHPSRRPMLKILRKDENTGGKAFYLGLRGNPWQNPYEPSSAAIISLDLTFTAPDGSFLSELHTVTSGAGNAVSQTDWRFPARFPKGFGPTSGLRTVVASVHGTGPVSPILYISGPVKNPILADDTGQRFAFEGLNLVSGQTVQINMETGTVLVSNPDTGWNENSSDVFHTVDFEDSTFWVWQPGDHTVTLLTDTGAFAVQWRDRILSI